MWWLVGAAIVILAVVLISKFRTVHRQVEIIQIARNHLHVSFKMLNMFEPEIDKRVWNDPYLLGYAQGSIVMLLALFGSKLSTLRKGMVSVNAIKDLTGEQYREVSERMMRLRETQNSEFIRGEGHGADVVSLFFNQAGPELLADPEVQAAMREAPSVREVLEGTGMHTNNGPLADAGGVLMRTFMSRHKLEAGY